MIACIQQSQKSDADCGKPRGRKHAIAAPFKLHKHFFKGAVSLEPSDAIGDNSLASRTFGEGAVEYFKIFKTDGTGTNCWDADRRCAGDRIKFGGANM
jgi:hypothetical protein